MTVRLTTLAKAFGESAAKKPLAGSQLSDPRAKFAFGWRELGAMESRIHRFFHLRSLYYLRLNRMSIHKMQCEFAQHLEKGTNSKRIKYFGRSENLIAESLRRCTRRKADSMDQDCELMEVDARHALAHRAK